MENITLNFDAQRTKPLYQQLYTALCNEILSGRLSSGEKLPSKRRMAAQLEVSINTVDTAYGMLAAEGYVSAKPKSGSYVRKLESLALQAPTTARLAHVDEAKPQWRYNFETASIDTSLFPFKAWRRIQRDVLAGAPDLLNHGARQGDENLRAAIATYLHEYRGAHCTPAQIVVGAGIEYLIALLARLFCDCAFAVEDPGYNRTHRILENNGACVKFVPVDESGMRADALAQSGASLAYVTPSHQFPTGVTMPIGRRAELLRWAQSAPQRWIIEDDYDSEFRFDAKPIPSLQGMGMEMGERVIYISTFSKSIAPAIRIGYLVLPTSLLTRFEQMFGFYSSTVSRFEQQTLCRFMEEGHFARHLNRLRNAYRDRRDELIIELRHLFGRSQLHIEGAHTGLHLLLQIDNGMSEQMLVSAAAEQGVHLNGLSLYYMQKPAHPNATVVLGYAGLEKSKIKEAAAALYAAWHIE